MIYTHRRNGGEFEVLGVSTGQGRTNMETRTVYQDRATGLLHHRLAMDFEKFYIPLGQKDEQLAKALVLREEGRTWRNVAELMGVSRHWLYHTLNAEGLIDRDSTKPIKATAALTKAAFELRQGSMRWKLIERKLGVNEHTLRKAIADGRHQQGEPKCSNT